MRHGTRWIAGVIALVAFIAALGLMNPSYAQLYKDLPKFKTAPPGTGPSKPDWTPFMSAPQNAAAPKGTFFERCIASNDDAMPPDDQKAMCACMAAQDVINEQPIGNDDDDDNDNDHHNNNDQIWANQLRTRLMTPYETFVLKVAAPCLPLEIRSMALNDCYRQTSYQILFSSPNNFDAYCRCYANASDTYATMYAEPLLSAKLATRKYAQTELNDDPAHVVMNEADYNIYMEDRRQECIAKFGIKPSGQ